MMIKAYFYFLINLLILVTNYSVSFGQGLLPTTETEYSEFSAWDPAKESLERGIDFEQSDDDLKIKLEENSSYSLRDYCPYVLNQGVYNNCVGWAVAYFAMSTQLNYKLKITNSDLKYLFALDPNQLSLETPIKVENWAFESSNFPTALNYIKKSGLTFRINSTTNNLEQPQGSKRVKISKWDKIDFKENLNKTIKSAILSGKPIVFGLPLTSDFYTGGCITNEGLVKSIQPDHIGYQAMCILGYNDSLNGGVYEAVTSYGDGFGVNGYIYIPYDLFNKVVTEAFVFNVDVPNSFKNGINEGLNLGQFVFENKKDVNLLIKNEGGDTLYIGGYKKDNKFGMGAQISPNNIIVYDKYPKVFDIENDVNLLSSFDEFFCMISMIYGFKEMDNSNSSISKQSISPSDTILNKSPEFQGGTIEMNKYISSNFVYPYSTTIRRREGIVEVTFIVETDGSISETKVEKGLDIEINNEVLRVIQSMPKWIPGQRNGIVSRERVGISIDCKPPIKK